MILRTMKFFSACILLLILATSANAKDDPTTVKEIEINLLNHKFEPDIIRIDNQQKIRLTIFNKDNTIEEFDSADLKREKIIPAGGHIHIMLAPLKPGRYEFMGEFHHETAKGVIIVDEALQKGNGE